MIYLCFTFIGAILLIGAKIELQKNVVDKAWARAVNYVPAVFSLTCFVFLVIFVIPNLIFR